MDEKAFLIELETILEAAPQSVRLTDRLEKLSGWDSLAALSFIAMADARCNARVSAADLVQCQSVADLLALLKQ